MLSRAYVFVFKILRLEVCGMKSLILQDRCTCQTSVNGGHLKLSLF